FPLLVIGWRRFGALPVLAAALAGCLLVRIHAASLHPTEPAHLDYIKDGIFGRLDDFVVGMVLAGAYAKGRVPARALAAASVVSGVALFYCCAVLWDSVLLRAMPYAVAPYLNLLAQAACACLVLGLLGAAPSFVRAPFAARPIRVMGMMCYSLYL